MHIGTSKGNVADIVILEVQYPLGVFDDGRRVRRHEEFDRLGLAIFTEEGARTGAAKLGRDRRVPAATKLVLVYRQK